MPLKVLVVGGAGSMGRWCAGLFKRAGLDVSVSSRKDASSVARSMGVRVSRPEDAGQFDIVVLSVPIDAVEEVASSVAPRMRPGSLLMDLSSLKKGPVGSMLKHAPPDTEVIGAHPLFGPGSDGRGRTVVLVPTERSGRWLPVIRDMLEDNGFSVLVSTPEEHDKSMAVVQGLTHFMYVAMARTLERSSIDMGRTSAYKTPVYGITIELVGRVLSQSPELYALIQSSEDAKEARRAYVDACRELAARLDEGDAQGFIRDFESAARYYGDTAGARKRSERIIMREMEDRLFIADAAGRELGLAVDGKAFYGIVRRAGPDTFTLETPGGDLTFRYEDVSVVSGRALEALKAGLVPSVCRDIHVKMPAGADPSVLRRVLSGIDGVRRVDVKANEALGEGPLLCRLAVRVPAEGGDEALQAVLGTIRGLGLEIK